MAISKPHSTEIRVSLVLRAGPGSLNVSSRERFSSRVCLGWSLGFPGTYNSTLFLSLAPKSSAENVFLVSKMKVMCGEWSLRPNKLPFRGRLYKWF